MGLRDKYAYAIQTAKGKFDGSAQEKDGKLYFAGSVKTEADANEIWNAIKTIPDWRTDIVADIKVSGPPAGSGSRSQNLHGEGRGHTQRDREDAARRCERLHEDLQREQGSAERSGQDQAGPSAEDPVNRLNG